MNILRHHLDPQSRREFVERLAYTTLGVTALGTLRAAEEAAAVDNTKLPGFGSAKAVIWLQMVGGMTHIDTLDPKTGDTKGPKDPITTKAGYQLGGALPTLAADHSDKLAIIRSMTSKTGVHAAGQYVMRTGYEQRGTVKHPNIGAWAQNLLGPSSKNLPSSVCINRGPDAGNGFFAAGYAPLPIHDPDAGLQYASGDASSELLNKRLALLNKLDGGFRAKFQDINLKSYSDFYDNTLQLMSSADLKAFKLTEEKEDLRDKYGRNKFGQGCLLARRLVENNVRFVEVTSGGWDMHNDIEDAIEEKGGELDTALSALLGDLASRGLLSKTLVVLCSEFGRTPKINSRSGRDHYPKAFSTLLAGAGIKGGTIYGSTDKSGAEVADKQATIQDFHSTVGHALGLNVDQVVMSSAGRPFTVGDKGKVIPEIFA
jgi:uncharacterized protein (DUF1501 family)